MLQGREDQNIAPQAVTNNDGQDTRPQAKEQQVMANFRLNHPTNQSDQEMSASPAVARNRNPDQTQDNGFLQNIMAAMGSANASRALPVPTTPNTII